MDTFCGQQMTESAEAPADRLAAVLALVARMESSLAAGDPGAGLPAADELVGHVSGMIGEGRDHPEGHRGPSEAHAELLAALYVFRNAAFAFRQLAHATGKRERALSGACAAMIDQGRDHLRRFASHRPAGGGAS